VDPSGSPFQLVPTVRFGSWDPGAPIAEPDMTYAEITKQASVHLPGAELTRRLMFRYTLFWRKPR
jgi:hypothetical protein